MFQQQTGSCTDENKSIISQKQQWEHAGESAAFWIFSLSFILLIYLFAEAKPSVLIPQYSYTTHFKLLYFRHEMKKIMI